MAHRDFSIWGLDARIAAALLLAEGRADLAGRLLSRVPGISREDALATVAAVLAESPPGLNLDEAVLIAPGDAEASATVRTLSQRRQADLLTPRALED